MNLLEILKNEKEKIDKKYLLDKCIKILLCIFIFVTIFPGGSSKIAVIVSFGLLMALWSILDKKQFLNFFLKPNLLMYSIYSWILINIVFISTGYAPLLKEFLNNNIRIGFTSIIFIYLIKTNKISELKTLVVFSISLITLINIWTIIANYKEYNISRLLSTKSASKILGIGSYAYIYGLIFFLITEIYLVFKCNNKLRYISIILTVISIYTIYKAEFMISMFLVLLGAMLMFLKINNLKKLVMFTIISVVCILIMSPVLGNIFEKLAENTDNYNLKLRFNDLSEMFLEKSLEGTVDLKKRLEVYIKSADIFINNPILGIGFQEDKGIGGHSTILDELAKYGIIGNIPLIIMMYAISSTILKCFENIEQKRLYFICLTVFIVLSFINNVIIVSVFYFLFVLCPSIIFLYIKVENNKIAKKGEEMKVCFVSNYFNHHQEPISLEMNKILKGNYYFIATTRVPQERIKLGYEDANSKYDFIIRTYESEEEEKKAIDLINNSDVVILGSAPKEYLKERIKNNKLTFIYSERIFKEGRYKILNPRTIIYLLWNHTRYYNKQVYMLCSSAFAARDYGLAGAYIGKCYKWGYFPKKIEYDIKELMNKKKNNTIKILWVSRFIKFKHPELVVELAQYLKGLYYDFEINMIGNGELLEYIKKQIKENQLEKHIKILGAMPNEAVRKRMEESNIFVFTSDQNEGWGAVLNESMNSGCAVVANKRIGSVPYLIKDGVNGFTYKNKEELFNKVIKLIENNKLREDISINAYNTIKNEWNAKKAVENLIKLVNSNNEEITEHGPGSKDKEML